VQPVTVEQYVAGGYPYAGPTGAAPFPVAGRTGPRIENAPPIQTVLPPEVAGTEIFISSLDTLMEITHRSRDRGGWMHPSVNHRVKLLRDLATDPAAVAAFRRRMIATRIIIVVVIALGALAAYVGDKLPQSPVPTVEQPRQEHLPMSDDGKKSWI
jgi:hypothetical protein